MDARDFMAVAHTVSRCYVALEKEVQNKLNDVVSGNSREAKYISLGGLLTTLVNTVNEISITNKALLKLEITGKESLPELDREELEQSIEDLSDQRILSRVMRSIAKTCVKHKLALARVVELKELSDNRYVATILTEYKSLK